MLWQKQHLLVLATQQSLASALPTIHDITNLGSPLLELCSPTDLLLQQSQHTIILAIPPFLASAFPTDSQQDLHSSPYCYNSDYPLFWLSQPPTALIFTAIHHLEKCNYPTYSTSIQPLPRQSHLSSDSKIQSIHCFSSPNFPWLCSSWKFITSVSRKFSCLHYPDSPIHHLWTITSPLHQPRQSIILTTMTARCFDNSNHPLLWQSC